MSTKPKKPDAIAYMRKHFAATPPQAIAAFERANAARRAPTPKGSSNVISPLPPIENLTLPKRPQLFKATIFPEQSDSAFKAFRDRDQAERVMMAVRVGLGRFHNKPNRRAEAFCESHSIDPVAIATTTTPTSGGYLAPSELSTAVIEQRDRFGVSRQVSFVLPMTSGDMNVAVETSGPTVYYPEETASLTESDFVFSELGLKAEKRTTFGKISNEWRDDVLIAYLDRYISRAGYALASQEDNEFINGDATSTYGGEVGLLAALGSASVSTAATGHDTWPELDPDDFGAWMAKLPSAYEYGAVILCSAAFYYTAMLPAVGGVNQGVDPVTGRPLFFNKPVYFTSKLPTATAAATVCALYGDFASAVVIGDRGIRFAASDSAYGAFDRDITIMKAVSRYDIDVHNAGDSSNAGAVVGLKTAS
jgi:HK97 family phage major capsid protein